MKRMMIALVAVTLSCSAMAQTKTTDTTMHKMSHKSMHKMSHMSMDKMHDCVMMKDGKMMAMINGKTMPMTKAKTMTNGTIIEADGTCKMKGGKTMKLKEGQCVMMNGEMPKMPMNKDTTGHKM
jgi:hypothetical protein